MMRKMVVRQALFLSHLPQSEAIRTQSAPQARCRWCTLSQRASGSMLLASSSSSKRSRPASVCMAPVPRGARHRTAQRSSKIELASPRIHKNSRRIHAGSQRDAGSGKSAGPSSGSSSDEGAGRRPSAIKALNARERRCWRSLALASRTAGHACLSCDTC